MVFVVTAACAPPGGDLSTMGESGMAPEERAAIAQTVSARFDEVAEATNTLDFTRLLSLYQESEELTYVSAGRIFRTHATMAELIGSQFRGLAAADLRWIEKHVDVLARDVAVVTSVYEFDATLESGDTTGSAGTFTCVYVQRDGVWEVQHSSHTFPQA
jgi:ketosteroid isomerase-like protein